MGKKNKFEVSIDKEAHLLYADLTVHAQPEWKGVVYYGTYEVLEELNRQGYNLKQTDCAKPNRGVLRSDNGNHKVQTGRWVFKLSDSKEKPAVEEKPAAKPAAKPAVEEKPRAEEKPAPKSAPKNPAPKKKTTPKPTKKQTTKEILEAYEKGKN